jgi:hypothetical protein
MFIVHEDALQKWCPLQFEGENGRRVDEKCVGDQCMFWRWVSMERMEKEGLLPVGEREELKSYGYCGAAGPPEAT